MTARLPTVGGDGGNWGTLLNQFLQVAHNSDGSLKNLFINVKDYGATGDGTTDDTAAIQSALNASAGHYPAYVPAGTYSINRSVKLQVPSNTTLLMDENAVLTGPTQINGSNNITALILVRNAQNVRVVGGQLVGDRASYAGGATDQWGFGISIESSTDVTIERVRIRDCRGDGIYVGRIENTDSGAACQNILIHDCISDNNFRHGLSANKVDGLWILGGRYTGSNGLTGGQFGIDLEPDDNCLIKNVYIDSVRASGNVSTGIGVSNKNLTGTNITAVHITNCEVYSNGGGGIDLTSADSSIRACQVYSNTGIGISVRQVNSSRPVQNIVVSDCQSHHNQVGLRVLVADLVVVDTLLSHDNTLRGIHLDGATRCTIVNSDVTANTGEGVWMTSISSLCSFGGVVKANTGSGVLLDGTDCAITGEVSLNNDWGVLITGTQNDVQAYVHSNAQGGLARENIRISSGDRNRVQGCRCRKGTQTNKPTYGVRVLAAATNTLLAENDLFDGGTSGSLLDQGGATSYLSFAAIKQTLTATATLDFPSTAAQTSSNLTVTVTGAVLGDVVRLGVPNASMPTAGSFSAWVSAADTVTVRYTNPTAAAIDPASGTFRVTVEQY